MPDIFISEEKSLFLGKILLSSCSPTSAGFALLREAGRGKGECRIIKNEAIRLSPDLTHPHSGKVTKKLLPLESETQRRESGRSCEELSPVVVWVGMEVQVRCSPTRYHCLADLAVTWGLPPIQSGLSLSLCGIRHIPHPPASERSWRSSLTKGRLAQLHVPSPWDQLFCYLQEYIFY